jgi:hypothetical protein
MPPTSIAAGVATSTLVAFEHGGKLHLERMSLLAEDGAGVLCEMLPPVGTTFAIAFRLSTAPASITGRAEVIGHVPTTPAGLALQKKLGDKALPSILAAASDDSATTIFRMSDLPRPQTRKSAAPPPTGPEQSRGFALRFVALEGDGKQRVEHHVRTSRQLSERLEAQGSRGEAAERPRIAETFHEGDLAKRALDW